MKPTVVNLRREPYDVLIARPSIWGNPFVVGRDGTREEVIRRYAEWIVLQPWAMTQVHLLQGKRLGCHCAPKACHGDVLACLAIGQRWV